MFVGQNTACPTNEDCLLIKALERLEFVSHARVGPGGTEGEQYRLRAILNRHIRGRTFMRKESAKFAVSLFPRRGIFTHA